MGCWGCWFCEFLEVGDGLLDDVGGDWEAHAVEVAMEVLEGLGCLVGCFGGLFLCWSGELEVGYLVVLWNWAVMGPNPFLGSSS